MFWKCFWYLFWLSSLGFIIGRVLPKRWFDWTLYPYKAREFEDGGHYYDKFGIRKWQSKLPDMSKVFKHIMPAKALKTKPTKESLTLMIRETCIAEWEHRTVSVLGFGCALIWNGMGGMILSILFLIGNLPFIIIQRYNRPRLIRLLGRVTKETESAVAVEVEEQRCVC